MIKLTLRSRRTMIFTLFTAAVPLFAQPASLNVISLPLLPEGFATREIRVGPGRYLLDLVNQSGVQGISLEFDRMPGNSISGPAARREANARERTRQARIRETVSLTTGTYRITCRDIRLGSVRSSCASGVFKCENKFYFLRASS